ncbi:MFS transporter [Shouchella shacheensis]|uniref:MFS transporter n=1 Tax=Shouchella shacheensis TaxID=1649580 RepID=UPI0007404B7B|nr:glycoside-pentoside-hexuronide (GPH):cation symporter [Shouchella shacheensis]
MEHRELSQSSMTLDGMTWREKVFYGSGGMGKDFASAMFNTYLLIFYTDVLGLAGGVAGAVIMVSKSIDAISNPIVGVMVDRTNSRWGKFRPYLFVIPIPLAVFSVLTFTAPDLGTAALVAYALITYNLAGLCFTIYDVAIMGMVPSLSGSLKDRGHLISSVRTFGQAAVLLVSTIALPMVAFLGQGDDTRGYVLLMCILGIGIIGSGWLTFFNTKERRTTSVTPPALRDYKRVVFKNKEVLSLFVMIIIFGLTMGLPGASGVYHVEYFLGRPDLVPLYMFIANGALVIGVVLSGFFLPKLGNKKASLSYIVGTMIFSSIMFFLAGWSIPLFLAALAFAQFLVGVGFVSFTGMVAEMTDYTEWKTTKRSDGVLFSLLAFGLQLGPAIASGLFGVVLDWVGYVANQPVQTETTMFWINAMRTLAPVAVCVPMLLLIRQYPINNPKEYQQLMQKLEKNKSTISN